MRQGKVFYQDYFAGIVTETNDGDFTFEYDQEYIQRFPKQFIIFSMPVSEKVYRENRLLSLIHIDVYKRQLYWCYK